MEEALTVQELIEELQKLDPSAKVIIFAEGDIYPALAVDKFVDDGNVVQIGYGWAKIDDEETY